MDGWTHSYGNEAILGGTMVFISGEVLKMRGTGNQRQCLEQGTQKINTLFMGNRGLSDIFIGNKGGGNTPATTLTWPP